jgi:hypothetical protein
MTPRSDPSCGSSQTLRSPGGLLRRRGLARAWLGAGLLGLVSLASGCGLLMQERTHWVNPAQKWMDQPKPRLGSGALGP